MTDAPDRKISGLQRLLKSERDASPPADLAPAPVAEKPAARPAVAREKKKATSAPRRQKPTTPVEGERAQMSVYVDKGVRKRGEAAFQRTRLDEGEATWSEFVETALRNETQRREAAYNDGEPFAEVGPLRPGRPLRG